MPRIIRNTMLNYIPKALPEMKNPDMRRIFDFNNNEIKKGKIVYLCQREIRAKDNMALDFAKKLKRELNLPLRVIHRREHFLYKQKENFIEKQINIAKEEFEKKEIEFEIFRGTKAALKEYLKEIQTSVLIIDFNPIENYEYLLDVPFKIFEIDGHNIIPSRLLSDKQEFGASTIRKKIYLKIADFLYEPNEPFVPSNQADMTLVDFIENKLPYYFEFKNNPVKNVSSGLSKYLNLGFLSANRATVEILRANVSNENKEMFFEELITRKELAENFCLYCKNFKTLQCVPNWAKMSIKSHQSDLRQYVYSLNALEQANTHDPLWNSTQIELISKGTIHGYLRMYWAKKILQWSDSPKTALKNAIYLNDKYAYDSPSPSGYTGILWAIAALHDRAFRDYFITGKIRRMTYDSMKKKFDITKYINENKKRGML